MQVLTAKDESPLILRISKAILRFVIYKFKINCYFNEKKRFQPCHFAHIRARCVDHNDAERHLAGRPEWHPKFCRLASHSLLMFQRDLFVGRYERARERELIAGVTVRAILVTADAVQSGR